MHRFSTRLNNNSETGGYIPFQPRSLQELAQSTRRGPRGLVRDPAEIPMQQPSDLDRARRLLRQEPVESPILLPDRGQGAYEYQGQVHAPSRAQNLIRSSLTAAAAPHMGIERAMALAERGATRGYRAALAQAETARGDRQQRIKNAMALVDVEGRMTREGRAAKRPIAVSGGYLDPITGEFTRTALAPREPRQPGTWVPGEGGVPAYLVAPPGGGLPEVPEGFTPARRPEMTPYQEASLDLERQRIQLQREAQEERRSRAGGGLTEAQKAQRLRSLRSIVMQIRRDPGMARQNSHLSDEQLMEQESQLIYGMSLEELRPGEAIFEEETPRRELTPGGQPTTAEEYLQMIR